jgi:uncharacterized protein VirK/YbjX
MVVLSDNYGAIKAKNDNNSRRFVMSAFMLGADIQRRLFFNSSMSLNGQFDTVSLGEPPVNCASAMRQYLKSELGRYTKTKAIPDHLNFFPRIRNPAN